MERSVFMKEVNTQNIWTFELGIQEGVNVPTWIFVRFQQRDTQDSQNLNKDTFCRPPVTSNQCHISTGKNPDSAILLNYDDDYCSQGYDQVERAFKVSSQDSILTPYISDQDFRSSDNGEKIG